MKHKNQPKLIDSGTYLEQALFEGLTKNGKDFAKQQIKKFKDMGYAIPIAIIRKEAIKIK